jgi:hypothetical protein
LNYYESVVIDYLRSDRSVFVNTECCIQLNSGANPDTSRLHWYCDAIAVDFRNSHVFLCEISYSSQLKDLTKRLKGWHEKWAKVCDAVRRDCALPESWPVRPWLFVPEEMISLLLRRLEQFQSDQPLTFVPRITPLEMVQPWRYRSWNRVDELAKPSAIPEGMRM